MLEFFNGSPDEYAVIFTANASQALRDSLIESGIPNGGFPGGPIAPNPPDPDCVAKVGDTGPGGGLIFVVSEDGCKGLEVSKKEFDPVLYGCENTETRATYRTLLGGRVNTGILIDQTCETPAADSVVGWAWPNGQTDGWLPSVGEWIAIDQDLFSSGSTTYWTSTEDADNPQNAFQMNSDGSVSSIDKGDSTPLRAVRSFDLNNL